LNLDQIRCIAEVALRVGRLIRLVVRARCVLVGLTSAAVRDSIGIDLDAGAVVALPLESGEVVVLHLALIEGHQVNVLVVRVAIVDVVELATILIIVFQIPFMAHTCVGRGLNGGSIRVGS